MARFWDLLQAYGFKAARMKTGVDCDRRVCGPLSCTGIFFILELGYHIGIFRKSPFQAFKVLSQFTSHHSFVGALLYLSMGNSLTVFVME